MFKKMKEKNVTRLLVGSASAMHLLVDGICLCTLYVMVKSVSVDSVIAVFLTYNILAFMSQPFTGIVADKVRKMHWLLIAALCFLVLAVVICVLLVNCDFLHRFLPQLIVAILLGLGNSLFHVWGGKQMVVQTGNDMKTLGVFVSTGAFGLALALVLYSWTLLYVFLILLCSFALIYIMSDRNIANLEENEANVPIHDESYKTSFVIAVIASIAAFVMMRSYIGETFSSGIDKNATLIIVIGAVAMLGKMTGGWVARWFGIAKSLIAVLTLVLLCYVFKTSGLPMVLCGIYLINTTMPITLYLANMVMRDKEGLAFGILAAALIPGYLLALL